MAYHVLDRWGRKFAIVFSSLVFVVGGILQVVAHNMAMMLAGRFIAGCKLSRVFDLPLLIILM